MTHPTWPLQCAIGLLACRSGPGNAGDLVAGSFSEASDNAIRQHSGERYPHDCAPHHPNRLLSTPARATRALPE
jgi:hypothetical protein